MEDEPTAHILAGPLQRAEFSVWRDRHIPISATDTLDFCLETVFTTST
jgi:hypothetical protein